jgi:hypothetical protein
VKWSFALEPFAGELHIIPDELPPADNLLTVDLVERHGVYVIAADQAKALRELLGTHSIKEVVRHVCPDAAAELERLVTTIVDIADRRASELRGEAP